MLSKISRFINTIKYLRPIQIFFQLYYRLGFSKFFFILFKKEFIIKEKLIWKNNINNDISYKSKNLFEFLNLSHDFKKNIDWNYDGKNLLWLYNLNYFDFLNQRGIKKDIGKKLIYDFIENYDSLKFGLDPYPTSLRIINIIKFVSIFDLYDKRVLKIIRNDSERLFYNLEYHLLGNHLLENAFALFFSSFFFDDNKYLEKSLKIIKNQLIDQIHNDGGHVELSPMYHKIILFRVLDTINLIRLNERKNLSEFEKFLCSVASNMLSWLKKISFSNNTIPLFNDSVNNISYSNENLFLYSEKLNLDFSDLELSDSGYRKISKEKFELIVDIGQIGCEYQPGHAHADTFNFQLNIDNIPIIVDKGVSTYNLCEQRNIDRSTKSHNTVCVENKNSSQVWSSFRVAERAHVYNIIEKENEIKASHNGYRKLGCSHTRHWTCSDNFIKIEDRIESNNKLQAIAYFHLHPDVALKKNHNCYDLNSKYQIKFENFLDIQIKDYYYSPEFNLSIKSKVIQVSFEDSLISIFKFI